MKGDTASHSSLLGRRNKTLQTIGVFLGAVVLVWCQHVAAQPANPNPFLLQWGYNTFDGIFHLYEIPVPANGTRLTTSAGPVPEGHPFAIFICLANPKDTTEFVTQIRRASPQPGNFISDGTLYGAITGKFYTGIVSPTQVVWNFLPVDVDAQEAPLTATCNAISIGGSIGKVGASQLPLGIEITDNNFDVTIKYLYVNMRLRGPFEGRVPRVDMKEPASDVADWLCSDSSAT